MIGIIGNGGWVGCYSSCREEGGHFCPVFIVVCWGSRAQSRAQPQEPRPVTPYVAPPPLLISNSNTDGSLLFYLPSDSVECSGVSALRWIMIKYDRPTDRPPPPPPAPPPSLLLLLLLLLLLVPRLLLVLLLRFLLLLRRHITSHVTSLN